MDAELEGVHAQILEAHHPEDLFGSHDIVLPVAMLQAFLTEQHDKIQRVADPGRYTSPEDVEAAEEASEKLSALYREGKRRIDRMVFGLPGYNAARPHNVIKYIDVGPNRYYIGEKIASGDRANLFRGYMERDGEHLGEVALKVAVEPIHNQRALSEAKILDLLHHADTPQWKHLPFMLDRFQAGGKVGLVLRKISGHTLTAVRKNRFHKDGVVQAHMVWMLARTLSALGHVHRCGIIHGAIDPDHVMVQPVSHNALLVGWGSAVHEPAVTGEKVTVHDSIFVAPEIRLRGRIGPWSDIYSLGKLMIWLVGGDPERNEIPDRIVKPHRDFLLRMVKEDHFARPSDAWALWHETEAIKDSLGPRRFMHLDME